VSKLPHPSCPNPKRTSDDVPTPPKRKRLQILEAEKSLRQKNRPDSSPSPLLWLMTCFSGHIFYIFAGG
jgi:hypothetical protein